MVLEKPGAVSMGLSYNNWDLLTEFHWDFMGLIWFHDMFNMVKNEMSNLWLNIRGFIWFHLEKVLMMMIVAQCIQCHELHPQGCHVFPTHGW